MLPKVGILRREDGQRRLTTSSNFREDINGLRAVAVATVILFHLGFTSFAGGFIGVDVFFVISGFLMTQIIVGGLDAGKFSVGKFLAARVRRIVPALMGMCLCVLCLGWLLFDPIHLREVGLQSLAAIAFLSNFLFWSEAGYFDVQSTEKWLLHTWSLSVEWQFYVIYPIVLIAIRRYLAGASVRTMLWIGLVLSLALSVIVTAYRPSMAFYLLPTRAWELLFGGVVALGPHLKSPAYVRTGLQVLGLLLIAVSVVVFDHFTPWPSYRALLPVLGTSLVIYARAPRGILLENPVARWLGHWSYSMYIWHWPIIVAFGYFELPSDPLYKLAALVALIGTSSLVYEYYKLGKLRLWPGAGEGLVLSNALTVGVVVCVVGAGGAVLLQGAAFRQPSTMRLMQDYAAAPKDWLYPHGCGPAKLGVPAICGLKTDANVRPSSLVIGDSIAEQMYGRWAGEHGRKPPNNLDFMTVGGCVPIVGVNRSAPNYRCPAFVDAAYQLASEGGYTKVVITSLWGKYVSLDYKAVCFRDETGCKQAVDESDLEQKLDKAFRDTTEKLREITAKGIIVVIVSAFPSSRYDIPREMAKRLFLGMPVSNVEQVDRETFTGRERSMWERLRKSAADSGAIFVDPIPQICSEETCVMVAQSGRSLYRDSVHVRSSVMQSDPRFDFIDGIVAANVPR